MKTLTTLLGLLTFVLVTYGLASYIGRWGEHEQVFAYAVISLGTYLLIGATAGMTKTTTKKTDPSGG